MSSAAQEGWYLAADVGKLAGVSAKHIGQWTRRNFIRASRHNDEPRVYTFQDVAEAMAVHELLMRGVPRADIRQVVANLRDRFGNWPLTSAPVATTHWDAPSSLGSAGRIVLKDNAEVLDIGRKGGAQAYLLNFDDLKGITTQLRRGGWALRIQPEIQHIEVDPERLSGHPTIRNRRIPVEKVASMAESPEGREALLTDYDLSENEIMDAVQWQEVVQQFSAAA